MTRGRGVLDTRFRGYDDFLWSGMVHYSYVRRDDVESLHVIARSQRVARMRAR
jgi:hypothetical protein